MDARKLTELLRATIDPAQQKEAEGQLTQVGEGEFATERKRARAISPAGRVERETSFRASRETMWAPCPFLMLHPCRITLPFRVRARNRRTRPRRGQCRRANHLTSRRRRWGALLFSADARCPVGMDGNRGRGELGSTGEIRGTAKGNGTSRTSARSLLPNDKTRTCTR